jgi:ATP-dependent DNA ligase I
MLLARVVATSATVAATSSRKAKVTALAEVLADSDVAEVALVAIYLAGSVRQRRTGLGWRSLREMPAPAAEPTLTVLEVDTLLAELAGHSGPGSQTRRDAGRLSLLGRATADEQSWLARVLTGQVRQGALDAVVIEAIAAATSLPASDVRRAAMLAGEPGAVAAAAFSAGAEGLAAITLRVGRPVLPMLACSAPDLASALLKADGSGGVVAVDQKLDGVRIQAHKDGDDVLVVSRSLDDLTDRMPEVVAIVAGLPADRLVLDGEAISLDEAGRPRAFQDTASRAASADGAGLTAYFFDLLLHDDEDLLDAPLSTRVERLASVVPPSHLVPRLLTADPVQAQAFLDDTLHGGHEGVVVKALTSPYAAGRRGADWVKVKPVHTLDLVVLAVEEGSGRRRGWLSNIHLGALDPETGGFVMLGKTFKGMTDEMLVWQTERFRELQVSDDGWVVTVRPEQVVEIAFDGVQRSTRYPGGVALRFARVVRYRDDKSPAEADTIDTVRAHLP